MTTKLEDDMNDNRRAHELVHEAARILSRSGNVGKLNEIAWHASDIFGDGAEDEFDIIYLDCAVCGDYHNCSIQIKRSKNINYQYEMEINIEYKVKLSVWERIKRIWKVLRNEREENDFLLDHNSLSQLRDLFYRMDIEESKTDDHD